VIFAIGAVLYARGWQRRQAGLSAAAA